MNRILRTAAMAVSAAVVSTSIAACSSVNSADSSGSTAPESVNIIVPADPGGGWDQTGRAFSEVLTEEKIVKKASVGNVPGAGGTVGLAQLANERDPNTLMIMGLVMVGAIETNKSATKLADTTPIAKLTEEQEVIVVPSESKYHTITDLVEDIKANGQDVAIAGGSAGGTDQILAGQLLKASGVPAGDIAKSLNYVPFDGGAESVTALLGGKVDAGISGVGEYAEQIKAGKLRALAVSGEEPSGLLPDVPTLTDEGIDLVLTNWRGIVAPGDLDDAERDALTDVVTKAAESDAWQKVLEANDWDDAYMAGAEFETYVEEEVTSAQTTLKEIGLVQ